MANHHSITDIHYLRPVQQASYSSIDPMTQYLQNRPPTVVRGNNGQDVIIPPLNTDIRFSQVLEPYENNNTPVYHVERDAYRGLPYSRQGKRK